MAGEDKDFVAWVHTQTCLAAELDPCEGRLHAHHAGERGLGQRAHDRTCIPLCEKHHRAWHDVRWPFSFMTREERREWRDRAIADTQWRHDHPKTQREIPW